jgi:fumarate reductase subunit D
VAKHAGSVGVLVKRAFLSALIGSSLVLVLVVLLSFVFHRLHPSPDDDPLLLRAITLSLYWPSLLLVRGGLDCPNADLIADKLTCIGLSLVIDALAYSVLCFVLFWRLQKRAGSAIR